ncbi:galactoside 3(4)-L-fucosyltransferase-like isoform X2 [Pomacea canaliculata]|uniref:galactoside 3(4)-L-fucosyltransferase-like isoform X2 n=1 Tax=Pomacea canaliculata TaxID=400727 RepID=UPI000D736FB6|nr:galactoside 3(4)-L-fucosyltransferase-like isoform X2 [Pomacea canaliculata]
MSMTGLRCGQEHLSLASSCRLDCARMAEYRRIKRLFFILLAGCVAVLIIMLNMTSSHFDRGHSDLKPYPPSPSQGRPLIRLPRKDAVQLSVTTATTTTTIKTRATSTTKRTTTTATKTTATARKQVPGRTRDANRATQLTRVQKTGNGSKGGTVTSDPIPHLMASYATTNIWPAYNITNSSDLPRKLLLLYNLPLFVTANVPSDLEKCHVKNCVATTNRSLLRDADAVMYQLQFMSEPEAPSNRPPGQIWIGLGMEPPVNYHSTYGRESWRAAFNWSVSYREDSDLFDPYAMLKPSLIPPGKNYTLSALRKNRTAAWFVGHCKTQSRREEYVRRMQAIIPVDIYGRCGTHVCPKSKGRECNGLLNNMYRFYLSFENSFCKDYVTEKLFNIMGGMNIVPVVRGGADYKKFLPPGTYIDAADFKSPEDLARYLKHLETDVAAYSEYLRRKDQYRTVFMRPLIFCKLCEMLHFDKRVQWYPDIAKWTTDGICRTPTDM